jgi:hypothetical protein
MPGTVNRMRMPNPVPVLVAAATSQPGRAVLRCLAACALHALQAYDAAGGRADRDR